MTDRRTGLGDADVSVEGLMEELLHSADLDAPSNASLGNAARALGVPFAVLGAAAATSAKASAAVAGHVALGHIAAGHAAAGHAAVGHAVLGQAAGGVAISGAAVSGAAVSGAAVSGTAAATVSGAAVSGAVVSGAAGAGLGALGASGFGAGLALSVAKAVSVGLLVGGATIGTVKVVSQRGTDAVVTAPRTARETPLNALPTNTPQTKAPSPSEPVAAEARHDDDGSMVSAPPSGSREHRGPAARTPATTSSRAEIGTAKTEPALARAASSSVQAELEALSPARAALRAGDGALALTKLREYEARFPSGTLRTEAEVLRVEARLAAEGDDAARAEAERFVARHPNSVHRSRLERLGLLSAVPTR